AQVFSFVSEKPWLIQKVLASTYASGGNLLVPWDVWQGGGKPRYFGAPADFAPWYGFVRAAAPWLKGYEDAFYTNTQLDPRFLDLSRQPVFFGEYRRNFHAYVRARPGDLSAPVVVHLVDWEIPNVDSTRIFLRESCFFPDGISRLELLQPVAFDSIRHETALKTRDFEALKTISTPEIRRRKGVLEVRIPRLEFHWGILLVYP
ncbi:MAG: hypothetical protein D6714_07410, partial [Bacteroidetes bacterium]